MMKVLLCYTLMINHVKVVILSPKVRSKFACEHEWISQSQSQTRTHAPIHAHAHAHTHTHTQAMYLHMRLIYL